METLMDKKQVNCCLRDGVRRREGLQRSSEKSFGEDKNILYCDCHEGFPSVKICQN